MKKVFLKIVIILSILFVLFICFFLLFKVDSDSPYIGKWIYKYTYLSNGTLHYTEEDGMESYIKFYKNNKYVTGDYASDVVESGIWIETNKGIYLFGEMSWLYKNKDGTLKTEVTNGKKVMFDHDFYNVLIKEN